MSARKTNIFSALALLLGIFLIFYAAARLGPARTAGISVAAASVCGVIGWVLGASIGVVTAGVGATASVPLSIALAAMCGYAGPVAAALGYGRPPVWAMPVFILGWCVTAATIAVSVYRWCKWRRARKREA